MIMLDNYEDPNHLDTITRSRMIKTSDHDNEFWISLFIIIVIFLLGVVTGNIVHDSCCHAIEHVIH